MKEKLKRKLRSRQGVTLILSLLAFLVCAMAASVLITAGTASSGTVSERAKMDQRYFSVTSAVELLRKTFDGKSVSVTVTRAPDGTLTSDDTPPTWSGAEGGLVVAQSLYLLKELETIQWQAAYSAIINGVSPDTVEEYALTATRDGRDGDEIDELKASVKLERPDASRMTFTVENDNGDSEKFRLKVNYSASVVKEIGVDAVTYRVSWKIGEVSLAR